LKAAIVTGLFAGILSIGPSAFAQVAVTPAADQSALLVSADPQLAQNKRLVYDFWREVLEGGHLDLAEKYLSEGYIQHNPGVATGRAGFVEFFSKFTKPKDIQPQIAASVVSITAEGDLVTLAIVRTLPDPKNPTAAYTTTWFDMFRVADGKIVEHWDSAVKD